MCERRKIQRQNLAFFTRLFDRGTGRMIGNLDNITVQGAMVICEEPVEEGRIYRMHMEIPPSLSKRGHLDFEAECVWCRADAFASRLYNAGFSITRLDSDDIPVIEHIAREYGLRTNPSPDAG